MHRVNSQLPRPNCQGAAIALLTLLGLPPCVLAGQPSSPEPLVQVGVFASNAEGKTIAAAFDTEPALSSIVYVGRTLCQLGAGNQEPPSGATGAWRFSARVLSRTPEQAVLDLTWRRVMDNGVALDGADNTIQLTLAAGERVVLDTATPASPAPCRAVDGAFEARYMAHAFRGAATRVYSGDAGAMLTTAGRRSGAGSARGGRGGVTASQQFDVDLWLVHSVPGRDDCVLHQILPMTAAGAAFAFAPVTVETPDGPASLQVTGTVALPGGERLVFGTTRTIRFNRPTGSPRDHPQPRTGSSRIVERLPAPDEVLAFEMPPVDVTGGSALPDRFSVRVRVTPR